MHDARVDEHAARRRATSWRRHSTSARETRRPRRGARPGHRRRRALAGRPAAVPQLADGRLRRARGRRRRACPSSCRSSARSRRARPRRRAARRGTAVRIMTGAVVPEGADAVVPSRTPRSTARRSRFAVAPRGRRVRARARLRPPRRRRAAARRHPARVAAPRGARRRRASPHVDVRGACGSPSSRPAPRLVPAGRPIPGPARSTTRTPIALDRGRPGGRGRGRLASAASSTTRSCSRALSTARPPRRPHPHLRRHLEGDYEVVREAARAARRPRRPPSRCSRADRRRPRCSTGVPVVCFPGNPVSTQLSLRGLRRPAAARGSPGCPPRSREPRDARRRRCARCAGKRQFLRGRPLTAAGWTRRRGAGSHLVAGLAAADVLIVVPEEVTVLTRGRRRGNVGAMSELTHLDADGRARMVDVGDKAVTARTATASGRFVDDGRGHRARRAPTACRRPTCSPPRASRASRAPSARASSSRCATRSRSRR